MQQSKAEIQPPPQEDARFEAPAADTPPQPEADALVRAAGATAYYPQDSEC